MISATDMNKERQDMVFERMMEAFVKRYAPDDLPEAAQFHAELHSLVRQIYRDAQEPLLNYITKITESMTTVPIIHS